MSLWRKRNVHHNEQKPDHLVNILTNLSIKSEQKHDNLSNPLDLLHDLSIKSDDLSIKSEEAMREVQRLGQEIQPDVNQSLITEPVAWNLKDVTDAYKLGAKSQQRTWVGLTEDERYKLWLTTPSETENRFAFAKAIEQALKERNT
jgi:hypothetical protein